MIYSDWTNSAFQSDLQEHADKPPKKVYIYDYELWLWLSLLLLLLLLYLLLLSLSFSLSVHTYAQIISWHNRHTSTNGSITNFSAFRSSRIDCASRLGGRIRTPCTLYTKLWIGVHCFNNGYIGVLWVIRLVWRILPNDTPSRQPEPPSSNGRIWSVAGRSSYHFGSSS